MLDFIIKKPFIQSAQKSIDRLNPKVAVHIPKDSPLPSVGVIQRMCATVSKINGLEPQISQLSDEQLRAKTQEFKSKIKEGLKDPENEVLQVKNLLRESTDPEEQEHLLNELTQVQTQLKKIKKTILDSILPEAFAVVRETSRRILSMRHFDVQMIGGMVLHDGAIAEMTTGEGKTLVATLPAYLNALTGAGVHVVTVNDYLAKRDREWMGPIYEFLGLTVGVIQHDLDPSQRQLSYGCDITYGTNNEFGFDYLRDNMVNFKEEMVQRGHHFAIVDEVDSILIDEARTPLIISGPAEESTDKYYKAFEISKQLKGRRVTEAEQIDAKYKNEDLSQGFDYIADEKAKSVSLTEDGEKKAARLFGVDNLHEMETIEYRHHILQALKAKEFFHLDVEYVIRDGKVVIVDEFTGRMMPGRRWSDGLHQAVEAKEGIKIERENQTLATITLQNYFRMYEKLAGMTGTAYTEANEFKQIYNLECMVIPTNRILSRTNYPDCVYRTAPEKFRAVVEEIAELHKKGQPVLVGTISIEKSELLSRMLKAQGIAHQVLNAKYHDLEAHIIAQAGRYKAVTIATNMAGRGTDIMLGGNAEHLAKSLMEQKLKEACPPTLDTTGRRAKDAKQEVTPDELLRKFIQQFKQQVDVEHQQVVDVGGLHVLGTERHESRRIDNQLRGRSGRQGDPGSSRFYVSLEDELMRLFAADRIKVMMEKLGMEEGQVIEHPWVTGALEIAQKRVEAYNFEIRKHLLEYDNVMNKQREAIYSLRQSILESENVQDRILRAIEETVERAVDQYRNIVHEETGWDTDGLKVYLKTNFGFDLNLTAPQLSEMPVEELKEFIRKALLEAYQKKEQEIPPEHLRNLERMFLLHTIDAKWKDHLYAMDQLKEGVGLRSFAQKDPLIEYKREGFVMFSQMYESINQDIAEAIFKIQPIPQEEKPRGVFSSLPQKLVHNDFSGLSSIAAAASAAPREEDQPQETSPPATPYHKEGPKVGRNDPCPCGSGKKYKKCCGQ